MTKKRQKSSQTCVVFGFLAVFLIISVFPIVPPATALTLQDIQTQIQALIQQIQTLQEKIQAFSERERERDASLFFQANLYRGLTNSQTNGEVTKLQTLLSKYPQIYPEALVTGYFGPLTEQAVQRYQEKTGIANPTTKGYGVFGPKTRATINREISLNLPLASTVLPSEFPTLTVPPKTSGSSEEPNINSPPTSTSPISTSTATISSTPNSPPRVNISYPYAGLTFVAPASFDITASAADEDGSVTKVELFEGQNLLVSLTSPPYSYRWVNANAGEYSLTAKATDEKGAETTSLPVTLKVISLSQSIGAGRTNSLPTITLSGIPSASTTLAVTASGNEITDASRTTNTQGDGLSNDSSYGIWEATTNLVTNGGFETNTTGWNASGTSITRVTSQFKFGAASGEVVTNNASAVEGGYHNFTATAAKHTISAWIKTSSGTGTVRLRIADSTGADNTVGTATTVSSTWSRLTLTSSANLTVATYRLYIETTAQQSLTFYIDGVQDEVQPIATPYVETDGGTATRTDGRIQASSSAIDETQGWFAMRIRMGFASTSTSALTTIAGESLRLFQWKDTSANQFVGYLTSNNTFNLIRNSGGAGAAVSSAAQSFSVGDTFTIIGKWDTGNVYISVNGGDFTNAANTSIPTLSATSFDIGSDIGTKAQVESDILWTAAGTGTLTDADASTINGFGSTDSAYFPSTAITTFFWQADTTATSAAITPTATASDYDGNVTSVTFTRTATDIVTDSASPFTTTAILPIGTHTISGLATDNESATTRSASSTITVN